MLTPDLVQARRKDGVLLLTPLIGKARSRLLALAEEVLGVYQSGRDMTREELSGLIRELGVTGSDRRLVAGLARLVEDAAKYSEPPEGDAECVRERLFLAASQARRELEEGILLDCAALCRQVAEQEGWQDAGLLERLYSDLPSAQRLLSAPTWLPEMLVARYDDARVQAVLLRAVEVRVKVESQAPTILRDIFRALKFRRLLYRVESQSETSLVLVIDGPYSLFESVTKYGLALAMLWPHLRAADRVDLEAKLRWGARRETLLFQRSHSRSESLERSAEVAEPSEIEALKAELSELGLPFQVRTATQVLDLVGCGVCVPDLTCDFADGCRVHLELMGFWSRDAVWRRVEWAERGLPEPVLFLVSNRLRVSEKALPDRQSGALYVFKQKINARTVGEKVMRLAEVAAGQKKG